MSIFYFALINLFFIDGVRISASYLGFYFFGLELEPQIGAFGLVEFFIDFD